MSSEVSAMVSEYCGLVDAIRSREVRGLKGPRNRIPVTLEAQSPFTLRPSEA